MLCIDYYEACQRKNRADSWNDRHSRVEVYRQQAQKKICWDFAHALLELAASSLASGRGGPRYCGGQQSGLKKRLSAYPKPQKELQLRSPMHRGFPLGPLPSRRPAVDLKKHMPCVLYNRPGACARSYCIASPLTSLPASCAGGSCQHQQNTCYLLLLPCDPRLLPSRVSFGLVDRDEACSKAFVAALPGVHPPRVSATSALALELVTTLDPTPPITWSAVANLLFSIR
jgi:hypothetical protein